MEPNHDTLLGLDGGLQLFSLYIWDYRVLGSVTVVDLKPKGLIRMVLQCFSISHVIIEE
jgi:hypothetical protein